VGADGAHSVVRKFAGIDFAGTDTREVFVNVDARVEGAPASGEGHYYLAREGMTVLVPLADGYCRVTASIQDLPGEHETDLSLHDVQAIVTARVGAQLRIRELRDAGWGITRVRIYTRIAERFRRGRCLLAGDAAHLFGPMGAQGMNSGIQDAQNLAWKLAVVSAGRAGEQLLDSYDAERRPLATGVLHAVQRQTRMALIKNPLAVELRDAVVRGATRARLIDRRLAPEVGQFEVDYRASPGTAGPARGRASRGIGRRLPNAPLSGPLTQRRLFDLLRERPLTVLALGVRHHEQAELSRLISILRLGYGDQLGLCAVSNRAAVTPGAQIPAAIDRDGVLHRWLAIGEPTLCLVRADTHLAYRGPLRLPGVLLDHLGHALGLRRLADYSR
jgi:FAD binding domain